MGKALSKGSCNRSRLFTDLDRSQTRKTLQNLSRNGVVFLWKQVDSRLPFVLSFEIYIAFFRFYFLPCLTVSFLKNDTLRISVDSLMASPPNSELALELNVQGPVMSGFRVKMRVRHRTDIEWVGAYSVFHMNNMYICINTHDA